MTPLKIILLLGCTGLSLAAWALDPAARIDSLLRRNASKYLAKNVRLEIDRLSAGAPLPNNFTILNIYPQPPVGNVSFEVAWKEQGKIRKVPATAQVRAYGPIAIARNPIRPGEEFSDDNIFFEERELTPYLASGFFANFSELSKLRATSFVRPGSVVVKIYAAAPLAVTRGSMAELVHQKGSLFISARVKALDDGRTNQWIRVENQSSKKILQAKVIGEGKVSLQ